MAQDSVELGKTRHVVASVAELTTGQRKIVTVKGREIGIFHIDDGYYALHNVCPHRSGPLCAGRLRPLVVSPTPALSEVAYEREGESTPSALVACTR